MKLVGSIVRILTAISICACLDFSPVRYMRGSGPKDAGVGTEDAGAGDAAAGPLIEECRTCLATGACSAQSDSCNVDAHCAAYSTCLTDEACWGIALTDIQNIDPCFFDCAQAAGLTSQFDPAGALVLPVFLCAQNTDGCASTCASNMVK